MARNFWDVDVLHVPVTYKYEWSILQITDSNSDFLGS